MRTEKGLPVRGMAGTKNGASPAVARNTAAKASCAARSSMPGWMATPSPAVMPPEQIDPYRIGAEPMTKPQYGMKPPIYTKPQIPGGKGTPLMPPISNNRLGGLLGAYPALGGALGTPILTNVDVM